MFSEQQKDMNSRSTDEDNKATIERKRTTNDKCESDERVAETKNEMIEIEICSELWQGRMVENP